MTNFSRRQALSIGTSVGMLTALKATIAEATSPESNPEVGPTESKDSTPPFARDPVWVYDIWSAYAEGTPGLETTRLTEALAMRQLAEIIRLRRLGVHFDYYMMNAFWFAPDGAYREWRKPDWPNGPDRWLAACKESGLKPGMWFGTNALWQIEAAPQWRDSLAVKPPKWPWDLMSLYEGGFLADFMDVLQYWYDRGVRLFELDVANFDAATATAQRDQPSDQIRDRNQTALREAIKTFRRKNSDVIFVAFNDFGGDLISTSSPFPFKKPVDLRWLEAFDTFYSGDIRSSDVPQANFWRSVDIYNDHMVRRYEQSGLPLERIDPFFTLSTTWYAYARRKRAWKGALLLTMARGAWKKTIYGDLSLLDDDDVRWFAKVQRMYAPLLAMGRTKSFGGVPGEVETYGFGSFDISGALYTIVNPSQEVRTIELPQLSKVQQPLQSGRVLFRDAGFIALVSDAFLTLGPGQLATIGFGRYANSASDLGIQDDVIIPRKITPVEVAFEERSGFLQATFMPPPQGDLRIIFQQHSQDGGAAKSSRLRKIAAIQNGRSLPVETDLEGKEHGGLSWSCGEIRRMSVGSSHPITVRCEVEPSEPMTLRGAVYNVEY